jgi:hypothetical protein
MDPKACPLKKDESLRLRKPGACDLESKGDKLRRVIDWNHVRQDGIPLIDA